MFEFLLAEWHLPPDYIVNNWTNELLDLMLDKLVERKARERGKPNEDEPGHIYLQPGINKVSDRELFNLMHIPVKVVKQSAN